MGLGLLAIFSFDAVDLFFISRLGDEPLAAASFTFPVIWMLSTIGIGFEAGSSSCVSRAVGQGDQDQARRLTTDTVLLATLVATVLCLVGLVTIRPVFRMLGAPDEILPLIQAYMGVWYWVEPVATAMWVSLAGIRARGNTLLESKVITSAALLNAVLDPILIFGWLGMPAMGIRGAAVASLVANIVMLSFTLFYLHRVLGVFASPLAPLKTIVDSWGRILTISVPAAITYSIVPLSNGIVVSMIAVFGIDAVAGFGVAMRIEPLVLIPFFALSAVSSPFVGQNSGAGLQDRLLEARRVTTRFCIVFGILFAVVLDLAAFPLAAVFTESESIQRITVNYLWLVSASYGAWGLTMSVCSSFNGLGTPMPALILSALRVLVFFLPLAFLGRTLYGLPGLFGASAMANFLVGLLAFVWLGRRFRGIGAGSRHD